MKTQVIELEKEYWQGMESHDYETVRKLTHFPCIIAGKSGVQSVDEASFKRMFESGGENKIKVRSISDIESQIIGEDTAVVAYVIELGKADSEEASKCACTSTWIRTDGKWACALHTETALSE